MDTTFLVFSLFWPRLSLLWAYYISYTIPLNTIPFWGDAVMTIAIPRVLILIYIVQNLGFGVWFWLHLIVALIVWGGSSASTSGSNHDTR